MNDYDIVLQLISEIQYVLSQLLSSGFMAVNEFTIKELKRVKICAESYNLAYAAENLDFLYERLEHKRHNFKFDYSECIEKYCKLNEYCSICRNQLNMLKCKSVMINNYSI